MDDDAYEVDDTSIKSYNSNDGLGTMRGHVNVENKELRDNQPFNYSAISCGTECLRNIDYIKSRPSPSRRPHTSVELRNKSSNFQKRSASSEHLCKVKMDSILKLKESTKKLLLVLEEIQAKTHSRNTIPSNISNLSDILKPVSPDISSIADLASFSALQRLETKANTLDIIYAQEHDDNCTIYERLTRKCHCLNRVEYNDFTMHFNEDTHFYTNNVGEIIKNMHVLKKFLYMNGGYTKKALMFLNEGLAECTHSEKVEITQGCAHADLCNVFEDQSIAVICISWPCKYEYYGDSTIQGLAAGFLYKLAELEEGRRYLSYSSKITNDIKKILKKKSSKLEFDTIDTLNATLNLLNSSLSQHLNVNYYCKPVTEGLGNKTINDLTQYRQFMTLDEIIMNLKLLNNLSNRSNGKLELTIYLPALLSLFKTLLMEYDNSVMNIVVIQILNNILNKNMGKEEEPAQSDTMTIADIATEPIQMKNQFAQVPVKKAPKKNIYKSKLKMEVCLSQNRIKSKIGLGFSANRHSVPSKLKGLNWKSTVNNKCIFQRDMHSSVIVVPKEKRINLGC